MIDIIQIDIIQIDIVQKVCLAIFVLWALDLHSRSNTE